MADSINVEELSEQLATATAELGTLVNGFSSTQVASTGLKQSFDLLKRSVLEVSKSLLTVSKSSTSNKRAVDELEKSINKAIKAEKDATKASEERAEAEKDATKASEERAEAEKQATKESKARIETEKASIKENKARSEIQKELAKIDEELSKEKTKREQRQKEIAQDLKYMFAGLMDSGKQLTKTMFDAKATSADYGKIAQSASSSIGGFIKTLGPLGKIIGTIVSAFGGFIASVLEQTEQQLRAADDLAQVGVNSGITTAEIAKLGRNAGYTAENLADFAGITKTLGVDISALGGSASEGFKKFAEAANLGSDLIARYGSMGVNQAQLNRLQADYIKTQVTSGLSVNESLRNRVATEGTLKQRTLEYVDRLVALRDLTGMQVEEQQRLQNEQYSRIEVESKFAQLQSQGREVEIKKLKQLTETMAAAGMSSQEMSAAMDFAMNGYTLQGEMYNRFGESGQLAVKTFMQGQGSATDAFRVITTLAKRVDDLNSSLGPAIQGNREVAASQGLTIDSFKLAARFRNKNAEQIAEEIRKIELEIQERKKGRITDEDKERRARLEAQQRNAALALDEVKTIIGGPVKAAFQLFMDGLRWLTKSIVQVVKWINKRLPERLQMKGLEDLDERMFDTKEDIEARIRATEKSLLEKREEATKGGTWTPEKLSKRESELTDWKDEIDRAKAARNAFKKEKSVTDVWGATHWKDKKDKTEFDAMEGQIAKLTKEYAFRENQFRMQSENSQKLNEELEKLVKEIRLDREALTKYHGVSSPTTGTAAAAAAAPPAQPVAATSSSATPGAASGTSSGSGTAVSPPQSVSRGIGPSESPLPKISGAEQAAQAGIKVKSAESTANGPLTERMLAIVKQVQQIVGVDNIKYFSGLNDAFHKGKDSNHEFGRAADLSLNKPEQAANIVATLQKEIPGIKIINEYDPKQQSKDATGGHIHLEARYGGRFKGPKNGYLVQLHGDETVVPTTKLKSSDVENVTKDPLPSESTSTAIFANQNAQTQSRLLVELMYSIQSGLEEMKDQLATLNDTQQNALRYMM